RLCGSLMSDGNGSKPAARRARSTVTLLELAQLAHAQWFFGNVYEAVVKIPGLLAHSADGPTDRATSVLGSGSPVRYYAPAAPVAVASTLGAGITARGNARGRRWLAISTGCWAFGAALTAYLVRNVNLKLFLAVDSVAPPRPAERD